MKNSTLSGRKLFSSNFLKKKLQSVKLRESISNKIIFRFMILVITSQLSAYAFGENTGSVFNPGWHNSKIINATYSSSATWTGEVSTAWDDSDNWLFGTFPNAATDAIIPGGLFFYPIITREVSVHDISIETGASVTITTGVLKIGGSIMNSGIFDVSQGTIEMNGSSLQTIPAFAFLNSTVMNIIITNDVTFTGRDTVTGTISFGTSNKTLTTGDSLTLKSTALNTARISDLTNNGFDTGNIVSGKINIEQYIPLRKAWRLLAIPATSTDAQTINEAWQEGVTTASAYPNPNPGYGVKITGGTTANGFDQSPNNASSIKIFNNASNLFSGLDAVPGTNRPITDYPGYFLYVRGDRSIDLMQGVGAAITATTLRIKGGINMNTQVIPVAATNLTIFGNPYPSAINFQTLTRTNVKNSFYLWDPQLSGNFGLGAYVTVIWNEETNDYDATASVTPVDKYIPAGTAIIVQSEDSVNAGEIDVKETDKVSNDHGSSFNRLTAEQQQLRVNLLMVNPDNSTALLDGLLTTYSDNNNNGVDQKDAKKMYGSNESINLKRNNSALAIERRKTISANDTSFLNIYQMKVQAYRLEIEAANMDHSGLTAVIRDSYLNTNDSMAVNLNGTTYVTFNVNSDPASYNANRFSIVFKQLGVLPINFKLATAYQKGKDIAIEWQIENELNIDHYVIEKSASASSFKQLQTVTSISGSGGSAHYQILDTAAFAGSNYYRIRSVTSNGMTTYSNIFKVKISKSEQQPSLLVAPNPVTGNVITLRMKNIPMGMYNVAIFNQVGQLIEERNLQYDGLSQYEHFEIVTNMPTGKYELKLSGFNLSLRASVIRQ